MSKGTNMKTTTKTIMAIAMVLTIAAAPIFAAQQQGGRGQGGPGGQGGQGGPEGGRGQGQGVPMLRMLKALNLTDEQQTKVDAIVESSKDASQAAREALQSANKALREAVDNESDAGTLRQLAAAVGVAMGDQAVARVQVMSQIKAILTTEQLAKYAEIKEKMKDRVGQMMERGKGRRGQGGRGRGPEDNEE